MCCGLCKGWKRISRHGVFQKGVCLLRTNSRDNVALQARSGRLPARSGSADQRENREGEGVRTVSGLKGERKLSWAWTWVKDAQSCLTLFEPMDYSLPGSSVHGILQAWILEWVAIPFSRGSSQPRNWTWVFCTAGRFFTIWATREALLWASSQVL